MTPVSSNHFLLSQLRQFRKSNSELTKNEPGEDAESDVAETVKDAVVRLLLSLRLHDVESPEAGMPGLPREGSKLLPP